MASFTLPQALAGSNNEVPLNQKGAWRVVRLVGGVAGAVGILAAGVHVARSGASALGVSEDITEDLY